MLRTNDLSSLINPADSLLTQLLHVCKQLCACSDEELQTQLHQLAFAQPEQLVQPVRLLLHSSQYIQQQVASIPALPNSAPATTPASVLSAREQEILALLAQGYTMPQIGEKLFISPATVNNHCARMREKLGLKGRNILILFAISRI